MNKKYKSVANVHYLPVGLTNFQKDLIEILISLHAKSFQHEFNPADVERLLKLESDKHSSSASIKLEGSTDSPNHSYPSLTSRQLTYMFNTHIRAVANHPCLLVDHYMPRQFLRMEPTERLVNSSDKFQKLQRILNTLVGMKNPNNGKILKIALISHSIKELDLLESLILGKYFKSKRLSGTSLYFEKNDFVKDMELKSKYERIRSIVHLTNSNKEASHGSSDESSKDSKPSHPNLNGSHTSNGSHGNNYMGYPKDDYDYSAKHDFKKRKIDDRNWLFLTTSTHLMHEPNLLDPYSLDLIISFDPLFNPLSPAIDNINQSHFQYETVNEKITQRMKNQYRVPIVKLLVKDTPDHYFLENGLNFEVDSVKEYEYIKTAINHFLKCRKLDRHDTEPNTDLYYKDFLIRLLTIMQPTNNNNTSNSTAISDEIKLSDTSSMDMTDLEYIIPRCTDFIYPNSEIHISTGDFNIKSYQTELMKKTINRLNDIEERIRENDKKLYEKRADETFRQNHIDELKVEIGQIFKKKQDLEKTKVDSEKRFERINSESVKLKEKLAQLKDSEDELKELQMFVRNSETNGESQLKAKITEYEDTIKSQTELLDHLIGDNEQKTKINDELRIKYQHDSTQAATEASTLAELKKTVETLKKEKESTIGLSLNLKGHELMESHLLGELDLAKRRNEFLETYIEKMTKEYNLKNNGNAGSSSSSNTNSKSNTPNNSEEYNSRHRSTRSNAPTYT